MAPIELLNPGLPGILHLKKEEEEEEEESNTWAA